MSTEFPTLMPANFFILEDTCPYISKGSFTKKHVLESYNELCNEETFATVYMGWNEDGIQFKIKSDSPFQKAKKPYHTGDAVEFFIDTRDMKSSRIVNRFCHHFFFLPEELNGKTKGEITRFRTEDSHPLCSEDLLFLESKKTKTGCEILISIPTEAMHGYDPQQFKRLGFTYRINSASGEKQHFASSSSEYDISQQPSLWGSIRLIK